MNSSLLEKLDLFLVPGDFFQVRVVVEVSKEIRVHHLVAMGEVEAVGTEDGCLLVGRLFVWPELLFHFLDLELLQAPHSVGNQSPKVNLGNFFTLSDQLFHVI